MKNLRLMLVAILMLSTVCCARAQDTTMHVNYRKGKPGQISRLANVYITRSDHWLEQKLAGRAGFTEAEAKEIMLQIDHITGEPANLDVWYSNNNAIVGRYKACQQYRVWRVNEVTKRNEEHAIVWLPYDENQHMPEGLRPTSKEGSIFHLDGLYVYSKHEDFLPVAGTPVPAAELVQKATYGSTETGGNASTSGTTASGVQYSTADMSAFGPGLLGCMAIYPSNGASFMYIVLVRGAALGDKAAVGQAAYELTGLADSRYRYEWLGGMSTQAIQQKYGGTMTVRVMGTYTIR